MVAWQTCLSEASSASEKIEVLGSHTGLAHLSSAVYAAADRLGQPSSPGADSYPRRDFGIATPARADAQLVLLAPDAEGHDVTVSALRAELAAGSHVC